MRPFLRSQARRTGAITTVIYRTKLVCTLAGQIVRFRRPYPARREGNWRGNRCRSLRSRPRPKFRLPVDLRTSAVLYTSSSSPDVETVLRDFGRRASGAALHPFGRGRELVGAALRLSSGQLRGTSGVRHLFPRTGLYSPMTHRHTRDRSPHSRSSTTRAINYLVI